MRCTHCRPSQSASNGFEGNNDGVNGNSLAQTNGVAPLQHYTDGDIPGVTIAHCTHAHAPHEMTVFASALWSACPCSTLQSILFSAAANGLPYRPPKQLHANGTSTQDDFAAALAGEWAPSRPLGNSDALEFLRKPGGLRFLALHLLGAVSASAFLTVLRWWQGANVHTDRRLVLALSWPRTNRHEVQRGDASRVRVHLLQAASSPARGRSSRAASATSRASAPGPCRHTSPGSWTKRASPALAPRRIPPPTPDNLHMCFTAADCTSRRDQIVGTAGLLNCMMSPAVQCAAC